GPPQRGLTPPASSKSRWTRSEERRGVWRAHTSCAARPCYNLWHLAFEHRNARRCAKEYRMGTILLIILIILLLSGLPAWPHARNWGYGPSGIIGVLLVVLLVLLILRVLPWGF